ncbi:MAG: thermonuclease family protein [Rhodobacteraceae bacterium]|nr:thermonuclease family protein [Paracoccaceae bacterium]
MPPSLTLTGKAFVIDGDTIRIQKTKIRLAGIDAPEIDMPWGQKAKWAMVAICKGQIITVKLDGERSHDRLVGTCYLPDGRDIGAEIIKTGLALNLPHFSGGKYRHLEPEGARKILCNGKFGHASITGARRTEIRIRTEWK